MTHDAGPAPLARSAVDNEMSTTRGLPILFDLLVVQTLRHRDAEAVFSSRRSRRRPACAAPRYRLSRARDDTSPGVTRR